MKRSLSIAGLLVLLAAVLYCAYMETHFATYTSAEVPMTEEQILAEMPGIAITDEDRAMEQALLAAPEVQAALETSREQGNISVDIPRETAQALLAEWLPNDAELLSLCVLHKNSICLDFSPKDRASRTIYAFFVDGTYAARKSIALYTPRAGNDRRDVQAIYENDQGTLKKYIGKRVWFGWLQR